MADETQDTLDEIAQELLDDSDESERAHYLLSIMGGGRLAQRFTDNTTRQWFEQFENALDTDVSSAKNLLTTCPVQLPDVLAKTLDEIIDIF